MVTRLASSRGIGRKRLFLTSHPLSSTAPIASTQSPPDCDASANPVIPRISSVYRAGLNWRMSYIGSRYLSTAQAGETTDDFAPFGFTGAGGAHCENSIEGSNLNHAWVCSELGEITIVPPRACSPRLIFTSRAVTRNAVVPPLRWAVLRSISACTSWARFKHG